jgi:hypothetical protein
MDWSPVAHGPLLKLWNVRKIDVMSFARELIQIWTDLARKELSGGRSAGRREGLRSVLCDLLLEAGNQRTGIEIDEYAAERTPNLHRACEVANGTFRSCGWNRGCERN